MTTLFSMPQEVWLTYPDLSQQDKDFTFSYIQPDDNFTIGNDGLYSTTRAELGLINRPEEELSLAEKIHVEEAFPVWAEYISISYGGINHDDGVPASVLGNNNVEISTDGQDWVPTSSSFFNTPLLDINHIRIGKSALFNLLKGKDTANGNATYEYTEVNSIEKQIYTEILIDLDQWTSMDGYELGWHSLMHELGHAFGFDDWKLLKAANDNFKAIVDFYTPSADLAYEGRQAA